MMQMKCLFYIPATFSGLSFNEEVFLIGVSSLQLLNAKLPTFLVGGDVKIIEFLYIKCELQNNSITIIIFL